MLLIEFSLRGKLRRKKMSDCLTGPGSRACRTRQTNHSNCSLIYLTAA